MSELISKPCNGLYPTVVACDNRHGGWARNWVRGVCIATRHSTRRNSGRNRRTGSWGVHP